MDTIQYALRKHPVIVSLAGTADLDKALAADASIITLIQADIHAVASIAEKIKETERLVFVHLDLMKGIKRDPEGIRFLANEIGVDGIVTTHAHSISIARKLGLLTIQRVFILDSASIKQGIRSIQESRPDAVEILPGIAVPYIKNEIQQKVKQTIIAAGLIHTEEEMAHVLKNGASGISSSRSELWKSATKIKTKYNS